MILIEDHLNDDIENYLKDQGYLMPDEEIISYKKAGEGNMNQVIRIITDIGKIIVKQSRPYVNKYPQIVAPLERIIVERKYYEAIQKNSFLKKASPEIFDFDNENYTLLMEDLGHGVDFLGIYTQNIDLSDKDLHLLIDYLVQLHTIKHIAFPTNQEMKTLNHMHMYDYPFMIDNGFDLDSIQPGLQAIAMKYKQDDNLKNEIKNIGARYLQTGSTLVHGDFYPGSWLVAKEKIRVIDPEFAYLGDVEFDLGVMIAHLHMAAIEKNRIQECINYYKSKSPINDKLLNQYIGTELLRRVIGLAQLPLKKDLTFKASLCEMAKEMIQH